MAQVTLRDLNEWIDIQAEQEAARKAFESQQSRRRNLNDWIIALLPVFMLLAAVAFYILSAPHTVALLDKSSPGWGWVSPVAFEFFIVVLAAGRQAGWKSGQNFVLLYGLLAASVLINVAGGFIAVIQNAMDLNGATFTQLFAQYEGLPADLQVVLVLVPLIGVLIPVAGKVAGEFVIKISMGEIKFQSISIEDVWLKERNPQTKSALMRAAMKKGAGARTAGAWAQQVVEQLYGDAEEAVARAVSGQSRVPSVPNVSTVRAEMGFAANLPVQTDTENSEDTGTRETVLRAKMVAEWVDSHPEEVKAMLARPGNKRGISMAISQAIAGKPDGYKTVERVLKAKGFEF